MTADAEKRRRTVFFLRGIAFAGLLYVGLVAVGLRSTQPKETTVTSGGRGLPIQIYAEALSVTAQAQEARLRVFFADGSGDRNPLYNSIPKRDIVIRMIADDTERLFFLRAGQPANPVDVPLVLDGAESHFPFDRYRAAVSVSAYEGGRVDPARAVPIKLTVWEGLDNWAIRAGFQTNPSGIAATLTVTRSSIVRFLACITYAAMALVGLSALTLGGLVYVGARRTESTLGGALGAMVFSLPALRNVLPGAPPLGVWPDILIFLWAEIAVVIGLSLFVWTWAKRGPAPS